jgi:hypothetical protein
VSSNRRSTSALLASLPRRALFYELNIWRSLYRWVFRRPVTPSPEAQAFAYASTLTPILIAFIAVSAIEIPVVHLLLPWKTVRQAFFPLGVWGVTWMIGLLASLRTHPHVVAASGLRVRYGFVLDVDLPWELVAELRTQRRSLTSGRKVQVERADAGTTLHVAISSTTNVEVRLRQPLTVQLPSGPEPITELHLYADDPRALVGVARGFVVQERPVAAVS